MSLVIIVAAYVAAGVSVIIPLIRRLMAIHRALVLPVTCGPDHVPVHVAAALAARGQPETTIITTSTTIEDRVDVARNQVHLRASTEVTGYSLAITMRMVAMMVMGRRGDRFVGVAKVGALLGGLAAPFLIAGAVHSALNPSKGQRTVWLTTSGAAATAAAIAGGAILVRRDRLLREEAAAAAAAVLSEADLAAVTIALSATGPMRVGPAALLPG